MNTSSKPPHGQSVKRTTDEMLCLDVLQLHRSDCLKPGKSGHHTWTRNGCQAGKINFLVTTDGVQLSYHQRQGADDWRHMAYLVPLECTACHLGGSRPWWLCPTSGCGRRVRMLFGDRMFACRHCHDLAYASTRESSSERTLRRAGKLRKRLGWDAGLLNPPQGRPKGMHWSTFLKLGGQVNCETKAAIGNLQKRLGLPAE